MSSDLERQRDEAMRNLRDWWDRNPHRRIEEAPMWAEYLAAFDRLDKAREAAVTATDVRSEGNE